MIGSSPDRRRRSRNRGPGRGGGRFDTRSMNIRPVDARACTMATAHVIVRLLPDLRNPRVRPAPSRRSRRSGVHDASDGRRRTRCGASRRRIPWVGSGHPRPPTAAASMGRPRNRAVPTPRSPPSRRPARQPGAPRSTSRSSRAPTHGRTGPCADAMIEAGHRTGRGRHRGPRPPGRRRGHRAAARRGRRGRASGVRAERGRRPSSRPTSSTAAPAARASC